MRAYVQLTLAQLRIFSRNRFVIFFSLLFPILLMAALGTFLGKGGGTALNAAVIDEDAQPESRNFIEALRSLQAVNIQEEGSKNNALNELKSGDRQLVVVIPRGYSDSLKRLNPNSPELVKIGVFYDETNMAASQVGLAIADQAADKISKQITGYKQLVAIEPQGIRSIRLKYIDFLVPGIVAMMIMSNNLNGVSGQIASWRERGILRRMQSATLKASTFISAQITARLILNGVQALLVLIVGYLFFGTQVNGSWLLLTLFVILGTLTFMSIGFIIAALARTPESAGPIAGLISFPLMFLGGIFFPVKNMPEVVQPAVKLLPITHLSGALRQVMNVGADLSTLWPEAVLLGCWTIVAFVIASLTFKWE